MDINTLRYNKELLKHKKRLKEEANWINDELNKLEEKCEHIVVNVGYDGQYLCENTAINYCLLCGKYNPEATKYPMLEACDYKEDLYFHNNRSNYINGTTKIEELRHFMFQIVSHNPNITEEQLIEEMNHIIDEYQDTKVNVKKIDY